MGYEFFDHTADLGIRIVAADLPRLFDDAAHALFATIVEDPAELEESESVSIELHSKRLDWLLFDWLNELLFLFDSRRLLLRSFVVECDGTTLRARVSGRPLDRRDGFLREVKAITYHGLRVERTPGGWCAEVIVDI